MIEGRVGAFPPILPPFDWAQDRLSHKGRGNLSHPVPSHEGRGIPYALTDN
jgi:hypothetical protein